LTELRSLKYRGVQGMWAPLGELARNLGDAIVQIFVGGILAKEFVAP